MSDAVSRFLAHLGAAADGPVPAVPSHLEVASATAERAADLALFLGFIALVYLGFRLLREAALPRLNPAVGTSVVLAAVMFGPMYEGFWNLAGLDVDADGLTMRRHMGADVHLAWPEVATVTFEPGDPWPIVTDDARLVLSGVGGEPRVEVPAYLPEAAAVARLVGRELAAARAPHRPPPEEGGP